MKKVSKIFRRLVGSIIMIPIMIFALLFMGSIWIICWFVEDNEGMYDYGEAFKEYWPPYLYKQIWGQK